jgi:signal transduction histidine kinase
LTLLGLALSEVAQNAPKRAVSLAKRTKECEELVQQLSSEIRTMSYLLHPPLLDELGLLKAIRSYTAGFSKRSGLKIEVVSSTDFERLPRETELMMFRTVQECLTNVYRHSGSSSAVIRISREGENVCFAVRDSGKGISATRMMEIQSQGSGVGLRGIRERVRHFGGRMHIESKPAGTTVSFMFPFPVAEAVSSVA